jgi:hypothetical protein
MTQIVTGDDISFTVQLENSAGAFPNISTATNVKVALVNSARTNILAGPYVASSSTPGADWATGLLVVLIPGTDTANLFDIASLAEAQVIIGSAKTTYLGVGKISIIRGLIP